MGYHGKPDWGLQLKKTVYTFDDLSELAVRLGSISQFDRRGEILFQDNFEHGVAKWELSGDGGSNEQLLTAEAANSGGYSIKLIGGNTADYYAKMVKYFPYPVLSKWGLEVHFAMDLLADHIDFSFTLISAVHNNIATIRYDAVNNKLQYLDKNEDFQDLATSFWLHKTPKLFNVLKLVVDWETLKYHRLILNEITYDLSAYDVYSRTNGGIKHIQVEIKHYSTSGQTYVAYIDNVILTQNEP